MLNLKILRMQFSNIYEVRNIYERTYSYIEEIRGIVRLDVVEIFQNTFFFIP